VETPVLSQWNRWVATDFHLDHLASSPTIFTSQFNNVGVLSDTNMVFKIISTPMSSSLLDQALFLMVVYKCKILLCFYHSLKTEDKHACKMDLKIYLGITVTIFATT